MLPRRISIGVLHGPMLLACMYVGWGLEQDTCSSLPSGQVCAVCGSRIKAQTSPDNQYILLNICTAWPQALTPGVCREATLTSPNP